MNFINYSHVVAHLDIYRLNLYNNACVPLKYAGLKRQYCGSMIDRKVHFTINQHWGVAKWWGAWLFECKARVNQIVSMTKTIWYDIAKYISQSINIGVSPSGKAHGFGPCIRGFESLHPSQNKNGLSGRFYFGYERFESPKFCFSKTYRGIGVAQRRKISLLIFQASRRSFSWYPSILDVTLTIYTIF